jgi:hypothetical protein
MSAHEEAVIATVTVTDGQGRNESERRVSSLPQLFDACRDAPPSRLVRISLLGPEGEVRLNFASFKRRDGE